jgi:malonyl CoA-acyl carrier protein transacylase/phosphopantetheinyl transferase (holo-ACP synthase)
MAVMKAQGHQLRWDTEVCILQAESRAELVARAADLAGFLEAPESIGLKDLAFTLNTEPPLTHGCRLAIVAASVSDLRSRLRDARQKLADPGCRRIRDARGTYYFDEPIGGQGKVAFLFPGEGAQYRHMLADVCMHFPDARAWFDLMDRAFADHERGYLPSELVFPPGRAEDGEDVRLWNMDGAVETVFAANQALFTLLRELGIRPDMVAGHSSGDYSALLAGGRLGIISDEQLVQHIRALNTVYEEFAARGEIPKASLLAVGSADVEVVRRVLSQLAPDLVVALDNCPQQIVLCGTEDAIDRAARLLAGEGAVTERLPFARPYHTPLFTSFSDPLRAFFERLDLSTPTVDIYSCATAAPYPDDAREFREVAVEQWIRPVRFRETIEAMYEAGARVFVEVGPRGNLTGFVENILRGRAAVAVATNTLQRTGLAQLNHAVGLLAAQGVAVRTEYLYSRGTPRRVSIQRGDAAERTPSSGSVKLSLRLPRLQLAPGHVRDAVATQVTTTPVATSVGTRASAMQKYFESMEQLLRVECEVMQAALAHGQSPPAGRAAPSPTLPATLPFVDRVVSLDPGRAAVAICELNLDKHRFLRDHTLGAAVSSFDPDLAGLPVLPLAVSIEMLAETASLVLPGLLSVGVRHVQAHRWVVLESELLTLRFTATVGESPNEVRVRMHVDGANSSAAAGGGAPLVEATIVFAAHYPPAERAGEFPLRDDRCSKWRAGQMYGRTGMFHGPAFQLVDRMDRSGEDGAEATLVGRASEGFIRATPAPAFLMDPVVLDAMGQIVGYWVGDRFQKGLSVFPIKLERLEVFTRALAPAQQARCRVRVTHVDNDWIRSDIDVVGQDGNVMVRMRQWEDRRLDLPPRLYAFRIAPHEVSLSDEWPDALAGLPSTAASRACRLRLPRPVLEAHGGIWLRVLAHLVLGREERREWLRLSTAPMPRRLDWLAGRIAAKEAVRLLLKPQLGLLRLGDIEIYADPKGRPLVRGPWMDPGGCAPHVTIAHSGGEALAIAIDGETCAGIGVDLEQVGRVGEVVRRAALTEWEDRWLDAVEENARAEWATRLWCAKEAVSKALGCGLTNGGRDLEVCDVDRGRGVLTLAFGGSLEEKRVDRLERQIVARTTSDGSVVTGVAVV